MKPLWTHYLWYNLRHRSQPTRWPENGSDKRHTMVITGGNCSPACDDTPHSGLCRAILNCGLGECASHGRTDRPSAWQGALRPRCIPRPKRAFVPSCGTTRPKEPSRSLGTHDQGASPLEPDKGSRALDHAPGTFASRHPRAGGVPAPAPRRGVCAPSTTRAVAP